MAEQHHELRAGDQTPQRGTRARAEIGAPFPGPRFRIHQNDPFPVSRFPFPDVHAGIPQSPGEDVPRSHGIRTSHVVVHDRHRDGRPDAGRITPHQVRRAVGDAVREGGMRGEIGLPLVRPI